MTKIIDFENLTLDDPHVWNLICSGVLKGVFQLEQAALSYAPRLRPRNIRELADLINIIRPGSTKSYLKDGRSTTEHFIARKRGWEEPEVIHPAIEHILTDSYQVLCWQEDQIKIAQEIAGFSASDADIYIRSGVGKKKPDVIAQARKLFIQGCKEVGKVSENDAKHIFDIIEKSARYTMNLAHSVAYAVDAYWTAYVKTYYPLEFFCAWLDDAVSKPDKYQEIDELISDAKFFNITVCPPSWQNLDPHFHKVNDNCIRFGLKDVKNIGDSQLKKLLSLIEETTKTLGKNRSNFSWMDFLFYIAPNTNSKVCRAIILSGALDCFQVGRRRMLFEYELAEQITDRELSIIHNYYDRVESLCDAVSILLEHGKVRGNRRETLQDIIAVLENPTQPLDDLPFWIISNEEHLMGRSLTYSKLDACNIVGRDTLCKEIWQGKKGDSVLAAEIKAVRPHTTKRGDRMCFLQAEDESCKIDNIAVFSDVYHRHQNDLYTGNTVLLKGFKSDRGFIAKKVKSI